MKKLLVTGGAGFIGSNFVDYWLHRYPKDSVVVLDALTYAGNMASLEMHGANERFEFVHGDICNTSKVEDILRDFAIDTVVHFAAESHVDRSISGPDTFVSSNIIGTHSLLKAAKCVWLDEGIETPHRFHHVSTDEVYGSLSPTDPPFSELNSYAPNSPYAASKAASDHLVRSYHHTYGLNVTTSNCSNNYGPFHFPEKLIPLVIINILQNKPLPIYGDGEQVRDWLYVEDHVRGIELILLDGLVGETYNIGGINEWTNIDIVKNICSMMDQRFAADNALALKYPEAIAVMEQNSSSLISYVEDRPGHDRRYAIDPTKAEVELGYRPEFDFEAGIKRTINWYLDNNDWWSAVIDGSYRDWVKEHYS